MKKWLTEIEALDGRTGEFKKWGGPNVPGLTAQDATEYCHDNGLGYCKVIGELIAEVDLDTSQITDYEQQQLN